MKKHVLIPHVALRPYIHHYIYFDIGVPGTWSSTNMAPPGCASLSITAGKTTISIREDDRPANKYESAAFVGQTTHFKKIFFYDRLKCFFVIFQPYGVYPLLGVHQGECRDICISLSDLLGSQVKSLEEELVEQTDVENILCIVEKFFLRHISDSRRQTQKKQIESLILAKIVEKIRFHSLQNFSIKKICMDEGYSLSRLERHMKKIVGVSPKQFQRIMRFNAVLQYIKQKPPCRNWSEVASRFGYYDQTHFIKEFKHFYGMTPDKYTAGAPFLSNISFRSHILTSSRQS